MTDDIRTIAVIGATGGVGRHVVRHALDAGHAVRAFARTPDKLDITHESLTRIQGNARSSVDLREAVRGADLVLSCLGNTRDQDRPIVEVGTYNLLDAMHREDVERVAIISSIGVRESGPQLFRLGPAGVRLRRHLRHAAAPDQARSHRRRGPRARQRSHPHHRAPQRPH